MLNCERCRLKRVYSGRGSRRALTVCERVTAAPAPAYCGPRLDSGMRQVSPPGAVSSTSSSPPKYDKSHLAIHPGCRSSTPVEDVVELTGSDADATPAASADQAVVTGVRENFFVRPEDLATVLIVCRVVELPPENMLLRACSSIELRVSS